MRSPGIRAPKTNFTIPPLVPPAVAEAYADYDRVCDELGALQGELADARNAINVSAKDAIAQDAAAIVAGAKPKAGAVRQEREAAIEELEQQIRTLEEAAHLAGDQLADAIGANRDDWFPTLSQAHAEAIEGYRAAIKAAQHAAKTWPTPSVRPSGSTPSTWGKRRSAGRSPIAAVAFSGSKAPRRSAATTTSSTYSSSPRRPPSSPRRRRS
jgi:hypothetical protein